MHRDTVTRSRGPLSCHSSTAITSCFSMIMHSPMSQGSVHNSWKLRMSQFFHGLHTHQTCQPLSMFGVLWIDVYDRVFQFPPVSSKLGQHSTGQNQRPDQLYSKRCVAQHEANGGHTRNWQFFRSTFLKKKGICDQQMHICIPNIVKSID